MKMQTNLISCLCGAFAVLQACPASANTNPYYYLSDSVYSNSGKIGTVAGNAISPPAYFFAGQSLQSANCSAQAIMQSDGNFVVYSGPNYISAPFATGTVNRGFYAVFQSDNNLVVYSSNWTPVWEAGIRNYNGRQVQLIMQTDANLVENGTWWASGSDRKVPPNTSGCQRPSEATFIQTDYMFNGPSYQVGILSSQYRYTDCANICVQDRANHCVAFSYYLPNDAGVISGAVKAYGCYLKNGYTAQYPETGVVSGIIAGRKALGQ